MKPKRASPLRTVIMRAPETRSQEDECEECTPAPQCFLLGAFIFGFGMFFAATTTCKRVLPACPVTSIAPLGPIGRSRVEFTYEVSAVTYTGSLDVDVQVDVHETVNRTVAVCYDSWDPARHIAAIDEDGLDGDYGGSLAVMWVGVAILAMASMFAIIACIKRRERSAAMAAMAAGIEVAPVCRMQRSDSAMLFSQR